VTGVVYGIGCRFKVLFVSSMFIVILFCGIVLLQIRGRVTGVV